MGMSLGRQGSSRSDINVTPLIDVVLVLLIIFLVTMPVQLRVTPLEIPPPAPADAVVPAAPIVVRVAADLSVTIAQGERTRDVGPGALPAALRASLADAAGPPQVFVAFDDPVPWREAVAIMDTVRGLAADPDHNGVTVALATRPEGAGPGE
ncbi:MAG: biopolymer transporter ExbD [Myxococcales bacterium]|nr:biopolymer transporter ExbD [Myxococcales bacterium]